MNIYNRIKASSAKYTDVPQYFICCYEYNYLFDHEKFNQAFEQLTTTVYPRLATANHCDIKNNRPYFVETDNIHLAAETAVSHDYYDQVKTANEAPVIATIYYRPSQNKSLLCYYFNHVFLDVSSAKILHLGLMQAYKLGSNDTLNKSYCLSDEEFLKQGLEKFSATAINKSSTLAQELAKGSWRAGFWVKAKRMMFDQKTHGRKITFQRFQFDKKTVKTEPGISTMAHLSAAIAMAYMQSFNSQACNFVIPVDLRQRKHRWLLGNPIAGVFIKMRSSEDLTDCAQYIQKQLNHYTNSPLLYWLYQLVGVRMQRLSDKAVFKKSYQYSTKSHFISTHLGNINRVNSQFAEPIKSCSSDAYAYSYPLQNSIAISLAVTQFNEKISINLSANEQAFTHSQQRAFAVNLSALLNTQVTALRPLE